LTIRDEKQQQALGADGVMRSEKGPGCPQMSDAQRKRSWVLADEGWAAKKVLGAHR
jgi:hypothetical protein